MPYTYYTINKRYPVQKCYVADLFDGYADVKMMEERFEDDEIGESYIYNTRLRQQMPVSRHYSCNCTPPTLSAPAQYAGCYRQGHHIAY